MYHKRQTMCTASGAAISLPELQVNEQGRACYAMVPQAKSLPAVETTDLKALLDAGVQVKQVGTKLFGPSSVVTDMSVETEPNQEGVNNNEE